MAISGGVGKVLAAVAAIGFIGFGVVALRSSQERGRAAEAASEARTELARAAKAFARCGADRGALPETSPRVPARLSDVANKSYRSNEDEWRNEAFECAHFAITAPQVLQYRWRKHSTLGGVVETRTDLDANGVPDKWFEIEVTCSRPHECQAANFPTEVLGDGTREPPGLLGYLGRAKSYVGEPPSLSANDELPPAPASAAPPKPLAVVSAGVPTALDTLYFDAERRAVAKRPGSVLLELEYKDVRNELADAAQGTSLRALYGMPDPKGAVLRGAEIVSVTFSAQGLVEGAEKASRDLHAVGFAECLPEKLLAVVGRPGETKSMTLGWDAKRERALWRVQQGKAPPRSFSVDQCSVVK
jgi:hypothetical protein